MAFSFIILAVFMALVVSLLIIAGVKLSGKNGGEDMIKSVYIYLVLFATLMMIIGGSVAAFIAIADIIAPAPYYQTLEEFQYKQAEQPYTDTEAKERYEAALSAHKEGQIGRAKNALIKSFGWIAVPLPVFIYFQRRLAHKEA